MEHSRLTLVMMAGLPGAGKTTLAYALEKELGWRVIDKDKYRSTVFQDELDDELASRKAYDLSFKEIYHTLKEKQASVIFDTAAIHSSIVDMIEEIASSIAGVQLKVVLCVIDKEERDIRLRNRPQQYSRNPVDPATIADYLQLFDHLPLDTFTLHTHISPEECLMKAKEYLEG